MESIQRLDVLPENIVEQMVQSAPRNKLIVETYKANPEKYGQTLVFAVSVPHAVQLASLFRKAGIAADYVCLLYTSRCV